MKEYKINKKEIKQRGGKKKFLILIRLNYLMTSPIQLWILLVQLWGRKGIKKTTKIKKNK